LIAAMMAGFLLLLPAPALAHKRVALVIGNADYQNATKLTNPANDAAAIAAVFKNAGFDSVVLRHNLGVIAFKRALREFADVAADAEVAVVYYAGHGMQLRGMNYLIPVDANLKTELEVRDEGVSLDRIMVLLEPVRRLRLVILDACRENPYAGRTNLASASRSLNRGLARVEENNSLVAFAAKSGQTATDGTGEHSPFAAALIKHIAVPGLDIRIALGRVRDEVIKSTANKQEPFVYGSLGGDAIALAPLPEQPTHPEPNGARDDYQMAERIGTRLGWEAFLARHKEGLYAELARAHLAKLTPVEGRPTQEAESAALKTELASGPPANPDKASDRARERSDWDQIRNSTDRDKLRAFIARYQSSVLAEQVKNRLQALDRIAEGSAGAEPATSLLNGLTSGLMQSTVPANTAAPQSPAQITSGMVLAAITELRRLACSGTKEDRNLGDTIAGAITRHLAEKGTSREDIKVVESLIADFRTCNCPQDKEQKREHCSAKTDAQIQKKETNGQRRIEGKVNARRQAGSKRAALIRTAGGNRQSAVP
jgi:Caspase domain